MCFIYGRSSVKGQFLNKWYAVYRVVCLTVVCILVSTAGVYAFQDTQRKQLTQEEKKILRDQMERLWSLGHTLLQNMNFTEALPKYLQVIEIDKVVNVDSLQRSFLYANIGYMYTELGKNDSALYYYEQGLQYDSRFTSYYVENIQDLYWNYLKDYDKWLSFVEKNFQYIKSEELKRFCLKYMKEFYKGKGELQKALNALERYMVYEPNNPDLENERLGLIKQIGGDDALLIEFEKKLIQNPNDAEILWILIGIYSSKNEYNKIIELTDRYLALKPKDIDALEKKANALKVMERYDEAMVVLKELIAVNQEGIQYYLNIGEIYQNNKKDLKQAASWFLSARKVKPSDGRASMMLGHIAYELIRKVMEKNGRKAPVYEDKLVGKIAYDYYVEAAKDPNTKGAVEQYLAFFGENMIPTKSDIFLYANITEPTDEDYVWFWKGYRIITK